MELPPPEPSDVAPLLRQALTLPALRGSATRLDRLVQDYARGASLRDAPLAVALVGATGAGKSTLLNALAGQSLSREGVDRPTSTAATIFAPADAPLADLESVGARVVRYAPGPRALWGGQIFIDTPDLNSVATEHREVARAALERADVALVVMHRGSVAEASQSAFLSEFASRRALVLLVNFADELGAAARETLKRQAAEIARDAWGASEPPPVFAISARAAREGQDPSGEFGAFLFKLRSLADGTVARRVRESNAWGALDELGAAASRGLEDTEALVQKTRAALESGHAQASGQLEREFAERLALARGHLATRVRQQAGSRFWGPAGWLLRLTPLGAGGLGAAALVSRASLPVGLAVATAATAIEAVRTRTRAHAAEGAVAGPLEEGGDVEQAARTALAGPRTVAQARGLDPAELGLMELPTLLEELRTTRAAAWRFTESTGVAESVAHWWKTARWLLLPLINLPLLALLVHVAWTVGRAYVQGPLLGLDYFLTTSALFAVMAGTGALLASASLSGAARRAERAGLAAFRLSLTRLGLRLTEAVEESFRPGRDAAGRLGVLVQRRPAGE